MAPMFGFPNYEFSDENSLSSLDDHEVEDKQPRLTEMAFWYMIVLIIMLLLWLFMFFCLRIIAIRQKTRSPQQRRMYVGSRPRRSSLGQPEPTVFVSPSNLPPPPKYEFMAPPSYEEVVGIHYPQFNAQPITQPITAALAPPPPSFANVTSTVINEARRTSLTVRT